MQNIGELSNTKICGLETSQHQQPAVNINHVFNFGTGSFKPKDFSEGTLQSIKRLRKHSMDMLESQNNNTLEKGGEYNRIGTLGTIGRFNLTPSNLAAFNQNHNFADHL